MSKVEGSGVGLVITKQLVEMMQGRIDFTSEPNVGSCFWLDFLLEGMDSMIENTTTPAVASSLGEPLRLPRGYRILYIEDNKSNIRLLEQFFYRHSTLRFDVTEDAWLGIYKARQSRPDVIILDINLPGLDGFEVFKV